MPSLLWLDIIALSIGTVIASSMTLIVLGVGLRNPLNRLFALFTLAEAAWAVSNLLLRLTLGLERGDPLLFTELTTLTIALIGPLLLMFTTRYVGRRTRWSDLAAALGLVATAILCVPLFNHQLVFDPHLKANGTTVSELTTLGFMVTPLPLLFMLWSLFLFWQERRRTAEPYLALSVLILVLGVVVGGVLNIPFPVTSITQTLSFSILAYGVIRRQLFNPLRELTEELEHKVQARTQELQRAYTEVEKLVEERTADLLRSQRLLQGLIEHSPAVIYVKDIQGRYMMVSRQFELLFNVQREDLIGKTSHDVFPQETASAYHQADLETLQSHAATQKEETALLEDGWHTFVSTKFPLLDQQGQPYAVASISTDITASKQVETEREQLQQEIIEAQRQTLQELSTPIIPVMDRIIVLPLVGEIDSARAKDIMRALLAGIRTHHAQVVILDITGVPVVDSGVANHLHKTIQAARLKGAHTIVTGISDAVAEAVVDLGIDWSELDTLSDLQTGLRTALSSMGVRMTKN